MKIEQLLPVLRAARSHGLGLTALAVLAQCADGAQSQAALSRECEVSGASMTGTRDRLVAAGLLESAGCVAGDRRSETSALTARGHEVLSAILNAK